jgi:hypothetical protein
MKNLDSIAKHNQPIHANAHSRTDSHIERNQLVTIEFTAHIHGSKVQHGGHHIARVAYSSLSQRLRSIHRLGGKIINVSMHYFQEEPEDPAHALNNEAIATPPMVEISPTQVIDVAEPMESNCEILQVDNGQMAAVETSVAIATPLPVVEIAEAIAETGEPTPKARKSRSSSKSASGFNKPKAEPKASRSPRKSK